VRIIFINRADAYQNLGGDVVQMENTARELGNHGYDVEVALGDQSTTKIQEFDIVHLFNLQTPKFTRSQLDLAKSVGKPVAVSTIWWDFIPDEVMESSPKWKLARRFLGTAKTRELIRPRIQPIVAADRQDHIHLIKSADILLPNSMSETKELQLLTPFQTPVQVVPNGINPDCQPDHEAAIQLLNQHGLKPGEFILIAARVEPVKNQATFVKSIQSLGVPVAIAGSIREPYGQLCRDLGAVLLDRVPTETLRALYPLARIHALPSFRETPGLASLEAASAGVPIVSTNIGSAHDYFGELANYCDPHDPKSMLAATKAALARPRTKNLANHVNGNYTWDHAAKATAKAYQQIATQKSSS
jgi:glycosyltransferase involved in cell wall biosynthesis